MATFGAAPCAKAISTIVAVLLFPIVNKYDGNSNMKVKEVVIRTMPLPV
jgi:hypothetical protein